MEDLIYAIKIQKKNHSNICIKHLIILIFYIWFAEKIVLDSVLIELYYTDLKATVLVTRLWRNLMLGSENFERTIANFDNNFSGKVIELLKKIMDLSSESVQFKLLNILYR